MKYRYLGKSGLLVSRIGLGTMTFGMQGWGCDRSSVLRIVDQFLEAGGNFIDTADMYSDGRSEEMTGEALRGRQRDDLVIATKCWFRTRPTPNAKGLSRKHICEAIDASLRRLQTEYIDLYQIHGPDPFTPLEETIRALDDLVTCGKVRYIGCSNYYAWQIVKQNMLAERVGRARLISAQHLYNILRRDIEREILPACADQGLGVLCWSPLAGGLLTGKYDRAAGPADNSRIGQRREIDMPRYWNERSFQILDEVTAVARETGRSPLQIGLAWLLGDRRVTAAIVGCRSPEQLSESLYVADWDLSDELRDRLTRIVPFDHGYPREWIELTWKNIAGQEEF